MTANNGQAVKSIRQNTCRLAALRKIGLVAVMSASVLGSAPQALADNQMGYQLLSPQAAASLPHNRGSLGVSVQRAQQITDGGMTFEVIRITQVRRGSAGAKAGLRPGDQIIAVNGHVFANLNSFAAYVGSVPPGTTVSVDEIPAQGGPAQAQRVAVIVGGADGTAPSMAEAPAKAGMSTGTKVAIGVGAAALFGCYEMGCFSHRRTTVGAGTPQQSPQANTYPQQTGLQQR